MFTGANVFFFSCRFIHSSLFISFAPPKNTSSTLIHNTHDVSEDVRWVSFFLISADASLVGTRFLFQNKTKLKLNFDRLVRPNNQ